MWSPTHIQVTVQRAKGLLAKGKNGTNNCFVTIALGKEKYQTSVKEKSEPNVSWNEECELKIPDQGNRAELVLTCLHRNNLGIDEFLGQVTLPLNEMDVYDRPRSKWFKLESKPGKEKKNKDRGELEVRISFIVKSGSLTDLSKKEKHKSSIGQLASSVGGSLLSIGTIEKRKGIKKFAKSLGSKMHLQSKKKNKDGDDASSFGGSYASIGTPNSSVGDSRRYGQRAGDADPGVISEDEDEFVFDNLSHKSSASSLNVRSVGASHLQASQNFTPKVPSPLLTNGKSLGKQLEVNNTDDSVCLPEKEPSVIHQSAHESPLPSPVALPPKVEKPTQLDEWEAKLYGKHLDIGGVDTLKRRSWDLNPVPLPTSTESRKLSDEKVEKISEKSLEESHTDSSSSFDDLETQRNLPKVETNVNPPTPLEADKNELNLQNHSSETYQSPKPPQARPRNREQKQDNFDNIEVPRQYFEPFKTAAEELQEDEEKRKRAEEDARLEEELRLNEQKLREEEEALKAELKVQKELELKRRQEDEKILRFVRQRSLTVENESEQINVTHYSTTPEQSPKERIGDNREKRFGKFKYLNRKGKSDGGESSSPSQKSTERIIIGQERATLRSERQSEITAALTKKYDGKSREELMLIANGMENEALIQRQRVKELEDYIDNLLLRVMETHPKILQNPYSRNKSAKG